MTRRRAAALAVVAVVVGWRVRGRVAAVEVEQARFAGYWQGGLRATRIVSDAHLAALDAVLNSRRRRRWWR